jgi:hypothetical protein
LAGAAVLTDPLAGTQRAIGHCFALNWQIQALTHLTLAQGKKEHDTWRGARRLDRDTLRHHAPAGRKVLSVYDCASIEYAHWQKWKQSGGIYFISLTKEKMNLTVPRENPVDRTEPQPHWDDRRRTRRDHGRDRPAAHPPHAPRHRGRG